MTRLQNGKVLVAGGTIPGTNSATDSAELYDPATGTWTTTGSMASARYGHTATLLGSGSVLVAGGYNQTLGELASAELYDPAAGTWTATGSMSVTRHLSTATLLPRGTVLVAGGQHWVGAYDLIASAELFDPATGTWSATGSMTNARALHTATLLSKGRVLVVGNTPSALLNLPSDPEIYDANRGTWTITTSMMVPQRTAAYFTTTLLQNGQVLAAGGYDYASQTALAMAELYY